MARLQLCAALVLLLSVAAQAADLVSLIKKGDAIKAEEYLTKNELFAEDPVDGRLPLMVAVESDNLHMIDLCLRYSANAFHKDPKSGKTPGFAVFGGKSAQAARLLLSYGIDPNTEVDGKKARDVVKSAEILSLIDMFDADGAAAFEDAPGEWERQVSDEHGVVYYFNSKTEKSQYQPPTSCAWFRSKVDGHTIYVNSVTHQTKWTRPRALSWKRLHDKDTGDAYWYNYAADVAVSSTPAELPNEMASDMLYDTGAYWHNTVTGESTWSDPSEGSWREVLDDEGRKFWYHPVTLESSWERPAELSWRQVTSAEHDGKPYWVNDKTGEASWDTPEPLAWESGNHIQT